MRRVALASAVVLLVVLAFAAPAEAATAQHIADNIKGIVIAVAGSAYIAIVVFVALKFLPGRHYVELGVFLLAAVVIGGIVLLPNEFVGTVKDVYKSVTKG